MDVSYQQWPIEAFIVYHVLAVKQDIPLHVCSLPIGGVLGEGGAYTWQDDIPNSWISHFVKVTEKLTQFMEKNSQLPQAETPAQAMGKIKKEPLLKIHA